jgi:hypothetical protein
MRFRRMMVFASAFMMVATLIPTSAFADGFRIRIEDMSASTNGYGVVINDDGEGDYAAGQPGAITVIQPLSDTVTANLTLAFSKPMYADPPMLSLLAELKLQSLEVTASGATTVRLTVEDTGYLTPTGYVNVANALQIKNSISNFAVPAGATITARSWAAPTAPVLGGDDPQSTPANLDYLADFTDGALSTSSLLDSYSAFTATGPTYSLFTQLIIVFGANGGTVAFDQDTSVSVYDPLNFPADPTPEPGSLMLVATAVVGLVSKRGRSMFFRS